MVLGMLALGVSGLRRTVVLLKEHVVGQNQGAHHRRLGVAGTASCGSKPRVSRSLSLALSLTLT